MLYFQTLMAHQQSLLLLGKAETIRYNGRWAQWGNEEYFEQSNSSSPRVLWNAGDPNLFSNRRSPLAVTMNDAQLSLLGNSHFPNAASGSTQTLVGYFRIQSGSAHDVYISTLLDGEIMQQDSSIENDTPAAPYRPAVTNIGGDSFLMVWSGGQAPTSCSWVSLLI